MELLIKLFLKFVKIGAFSFGGGYTALSLMERELVNNGHWLEMEEFLDVLALSQITPGPVGINASTYVGFKLMGVKGAIFATIGVIIVSFILVNIVAHFFLKFRESNIVKSILIGLKPAILGIIVTVVLKIGKVSIKGIREVFIVSIVMYLLIKVKLHPILVIFLSGLSGLILY